MHRALSTQRLVHLRKDDVSLLPKKGVNFLDTLWNQGIGGDFTAKILVLQVPWLIFCRDS